MTYRTGPKKQPQKPHGAELLRCTGISERVIVQGMYEWLELGPSDGARPDQFALVLIGKDLDRVEIERGWALYHSEPG